MKFSFRTVGIFLNVEVKIDDVTIDLGLFNVDERCNLASELSSAVVDLLNNLPKSRESK